MGYFLLLIVAVMFSFVGTLSKNIAPYFTTEFVTFFRFFFGVFFLWLLKLIKRHRFAENFREVFRECFKWLIFGAVIKWCAYLLENYALAHGPSYGNIVCQPSQAVFMALASVFIFKDKLTPKKLFCIALCISGVLVISWNGRPIGEFFGENLILTVLYIIAGMCSGAHVLAQKMVADKMNIIDSNLTIFAMSAVLALIPVVPSVAGGAVAGVHPSAMCLFAIPSIGFITGIAFYLNAKAIPMVPFFMVAIVQNTMVFFSMLWGILFFNEKITVYTIAGTAVFVIGLVALNLLNRKTAK